MRWDLLVDFFGKLDDASSPNFTRRWERNPSVGSLRKFGVWPTTWTQVSVSTWEIQRAEMRVGWLGQTWGNPAPQSLQEYLPWATQEKWQTARCRLPSLEMDHQKLWGWDRVWSAKGHVSSTWWKSSSVKSWQKQPSRARTLCQPGKNLLSAQLSSPLPHCSGQRNVDLKVRREVSMKAGFPGSPVAKGLGTSRGLGLGEVRLVEKVGNGLSYGADFFNYWIEIVL